MPRKNVGEKLEKVVSTTISAYEFNLLQEFARIYYNRTWIDQPTTAHIIRFIIKRWAADREDEKIRIGSRSAKSP